MNRLPDYIKISRDKLIINTEKDPSEIGPDRIIEALKNQGIKGKINYENISTSAAENPLLKYIDRKIIAEAPATLRAECKMIPSVETLNDFESLYPVFEAAGSSIDLIKSKTAVEKDQEPESAFVRSGEVFLKITQSETAEDLYGAPVKIQALRPVKYNSSCIKEDQIGNELLYYAERSGYIVYKNGIISIESPVFQKDNYRLFYLFFPIINGNECLENDYRNHVDLHKEKYPTAPVPLPSELSGDSEPSDFNAYLKDISRGTVPVNGSDAEIRIFARVENSDDVNDLKEKKNYITVKKHAVIAEKKPCIKNQDGRDIYGKIIETRAGKDKNLSYNSLIFEDQTADRILYTASCDGILKISEKSIKLSEAMMIPGSVDFSTGNIDYEKDVCVGKDVKPQFKVSTGGNLVIKGSIEDGASIRAKGDLVVDGGIFGSSTKIFVEGDATVKFIQDADVYVSGELLVKTSLIGGKVYTGKKLTVRGKKGSRKNQVFGGEYYSFTGMELHSAGSEYKPTLLCCGYNPHIENLITKAEETAKSFELKISQTMNSVGFNINDPSAVHLIKRLPEKKKAALKEKLQKLKTLTSNYNALQQKKKQLIENLYSERPEMLQMIIHDRISPDTTIRFIKTERNIKRELSACRILLNDEGIDIIHI